MRNRLATMTMEKPFDCVLLADRHHGLTEGVRGLLETLFDTVVMVADARSLQESAERLQPQLVVADISLTRDSSLHWLQRLRQRCPETKLIVLSFHDEPSVRRAAIEAGAAGFVLTRAIATELLPAVESVMPDRRDAASDERSQDEVSSSAGTVPARPGRCRRAQSQETASNCRRSDAKPLSCNLARKVGGTWHPTCFRC